MADVIYSLEPHCADQRGPRPSSEVPTADTPVQPLDAVSDDKTADMYVRAAEKQKPDLRNNDTFLQTKALIDGVRAAGNWKQYCRRDHKQILRLRSLIARGRPGSAWRPRGR